MNYSTITQQYIENYLLDPTMYVLPNLYQVNKIYHLSKNHDTIALYNSDNKTILSPIKLNTVDAAAAYILRELNKLGITHTNTNFRQLTNNDIQKYINSDKNYYRDIYNNKTNIKYYLYKNHEGNLIELNTINDRVEYTFQELHSITPTTIVTELNKLGITHTTNPDLTTNADKGGKRRSKSRIRRKRSQKRKKYKRRQHTYRKFKTKV